MGILDQFGNPIETRATTSAPTDWLIEAFGGGARSTAGERVNPNLAMTVMTFFACVRNISEDMAKLPKRVRRKEGRSRIDLPAHPVNRLFRRPNPETDRHTFWATLFSHALTRHGGFAEIVRDGAGYPVELWILEPSHVSVMRSRRTGEILYHYSDGGTQVAFRQDQIFHLHGLGHDCISGYTISTLATQLIGAAIAMQKYRGSFFGNGANPSGVLTHPAVLGDEAAERLRRQFNQRYSGADNAQSVLLLEEGLTWTPISVNPDDSQSVELNDVTIVDICRAFRMPPHKVQHLNNAHYANIEQDNINYATDTLDPWRDRFQSEAEFKLIRESELAQGDYVDVELKALMRGDTAARVAFYKELYYMGAISANDILELEDENPVPDGDRRFVQANLIPADRVDDFMDKSAAPAPMAEPAPDDEPDDEPDQPDDDPQARAYQTVIESVINGILRVEANKIKEGKTKGDYWDIHAGNMRSRMIDVVAAAVNGLESPADPAEVVDQYIMAHVARSQDEQGRITKKAINLRARSAALAIMESILCTTAV